MAGETEQQFEARLKAAENAHQVFRKNYELVFGLVGSFSNGAMRAPAIAAAGGIAAMLGFYSANAKVLTGTPAAADFSAALAYFFAAVFLCVLTPGCAYLSQGAFVYSMGSYTLDYDHPYAHETTASKRWHFVGVALQVVSIIITLLAIAGVALGAWHFMRVANFAAGV